MRKATLTSQRQRKTGVVFSLFGLVIQCIFMTCILMTWMSEATIASPSSPQASLHVNPRVASTYMSGEEYRKFEEENQSLHGFIKKSVPQMLKHTGALAFDDHLKGVQSVLRYWRCDPGDLRKIYTTFPPEPPHK